LDHAQIFIGVSGGRFLWSSYEIATQ
jgi:hypothetical protein